MDDSFFSLDRQDQAEALEAVRALTGRPTHLLEKDAWVVWTLGALFESPLGKDLTFKGGTSLSKAFKVIDRFSEDIDLTYDIRQLIGDLTGDGDGLPSTRSQASKWTSAVRDRTPGWIESHVRPVLTSALVSGGLPGRLELVGDGRDKLLLHYPAVGQGTGYVAPAVVLEFGARATGEPHQVIPITCDMDGYLNGVSFPTARPQVLSVNRTFWEKATAAHVFCRQGRFRGERYARHWYDLAALSGSKFLVPAILDREVALSVARHKSIFFAEKDETGSAIDYFSAVSGHLRLVPEGNAMAALAADYAAMVEDQLMLGDAPGFDALMQACAQAEVLANQAARATIGGLA